MQVKKYLLVIGTVIVVLFASYFLLQRNYTQSSSYRKITKAEAEVQAHKKQAVKEVNEQEKQNQVLYIGCNGFY